MNISTLLHELHQRGVDVAIDGEDLSVEGPEHAVTQELLAVIRSLKPGLRQLLLRDSSRPVLPNPEVLRRAEIFRQQIRAWLASGRIATPTLAMPAAPPVGDHPRARKSG
jgi:hypothetical protein